jgi:hypothetical protein
MTAVLDDVWTVCVFALFCEVLVFLSVKTDGLDSSIEGKTA